MENTLHRKDGNSLVIDYDGIIPKPFKLYDFLQTHALETPSYVKENFEEIVEKLEQYAQFEDFDLSWIKTCENAFQFMDIANLKIKEYNDSCTIVYNDYEKILIKCNPISPDYTVNALNVVEIDLIPSRFKPIVKQCLARLIAMGVYPITIAGYELIEQAGYILELMENNQESYEDFPEEDDEKEERVNCWCFEDGVCVTEPQLKAYQKQYKKWFKKLIGFDKYRDKEIKIGKSVPDALKLWHYLIEILYRNGFSLMKEVAAPGNAINGDPDLGPMIISYSDTIGFIFNTESWFNSFHNFAFNSRYQEQEFVSCFGKFEYCFEDEVITRESDDITHMVNSVFAFDIETLNFYFNGDIRSNIQAIFNFYGAGKLSEKFVLNRKEKSYQWEVRSLSNRAKTRS